MEATTTGNPWQLVRNPPGVGRKRQPSWPVIGFVCVALWVVPTFGQVSLGGRGKNFVAPVTDAQGRKSVLRGKDVKPAGKGLVEITGMQAETYRGQEKDLVVEAPQCLFDSKSNTATSPGDLSIRTADERFSIQGRGFHWQLGDSRSNSKLAISNAVHSLVRKRSISAKALTGTGAPPAASTTPSTNDFIRITSDEFDYQADAAIFRGTVQVHDAEGDLSCGILRVNFGTGNAGVERIEAEQEVVLQQGTTRAISEKAVYTVGQERETIEFTGHALWQEGDRQGSGERLVFDRRKRTVDAETKAYLKLPKSTLGTAGFLASSAAPDESRTATNARSAFVEVFADRMQIQLPATNGPVQEVIAEKNVLIVDPDQDGRALADRAVYEEATGILELTGSPVLESVRRLVNGRSLKFERATRSFKAAPEAYVKLPFQAVTELGLFTINRPSSKTSATVARTNQFIEIWSQSFEYTTNQLKFSGDVRATFLEADVARGKLSCGELTLGYQQRLKSMLAENDVRLEQFAIPDDPKAVSRKVRCAILQASFTPAGRIEMATAERGVEAEQEEKRLDRPRPILTKVHAESVTANFAPISNRVSRIVADQDVVFVQDERMARGKQAIYTDSTGLVELTGNPTAAMPEGQIREADRLVWERAGGRFIGQGKFHSTWKKPPAATNRVSSVEMPSP